MAARIAPKGCGLNEELLAELEELLTRRQFEVIRLRYFEGIASDRLVAEHLGVCRAAVTRRRLRALERIRKTKTVEFC